MCLWSNTTQGLVLVSFSNFLKLQLLDELNIMPNLGRAGPFHEYIQGPNCKSINYELNLALHCAKRKRLGLVWVGPGSCNPEASGSNPPPCFRMDFCSVVPSSASSRLVNEKRINFQPVAVFNKFTVFVYRLVVSPTNTAVLNIPQLWSDLFVLVTQRSSVYNLIYLTHEQILLERRTLQMIPILCNRCNSSVCKPHTGGSVRCQASPSHAHSFKINGR